MTNNITTPQLNDTITFRTKHAYDNILYKGKVTSICNYNTAKSYGDLISYHSTVLKSDASIGPLESLTYLLIELDNDIMVSLQTTQKVRVFAIDWIEEGSLTILNESASRIIKIFNIDDTLFDDTVESLRSRGLVVIEM
jgi:hypothetical protein